MQRRGLRYRENPRNNAEMGGLLERERADVREAAGWVGRGRGRRRGALWAAGRGEVRADFGSGETKQWSSTVAGGVRARSPLQNWLGQGVSPSGCFLLDWGVFNINSNDCGGKIIGLRQIRRG